MSLASLSLMHLALTGAPLDLERLMELGAPLVAKAPEPPPTFFKRPQDAATWLRSLALHVPGHRDFDLDRPELETTQA